MNEQIGGTIISRQVGGVIAILNPGDVPSARLKPDELISLRTVPNHQKVESARATFRQQIKRIKQRFSIFFPGESAHVEKQRLICLDVERVASAGNDVGIGIEDLDVHAEVNDTNISHTPL